MRSKTKRDYLSALDKFFSNTNEIKSPAELRVLTANKSKHLVLGLRNFVRYLKETGKITRETALDYLEVLKPKKSNVREVYLTEKEIREAIKQMKKRFKRYYAIFLLLYFSGARLSAVFNMIQTFDKSKLTKIDDKNARYSVSMVNNNTKNNLYIYAPIWVFEEVEKHLDELKKTAYNTLAKYTSYKRVSPNSLRKFFYTKSIQIGIPESIVDFIQSRDIPRIGSKVYLDKLRLADMKYKEISKALLKIIEKQKH